MLASLVGRHVDLIRWSFGWDHKRHIVPCKSKHDSTKIALLRGQDRSADCPAQRPRSLSRLPCSEVKIAQQIALLRGQDRSAEAHTFPSTTWNLPINLQNWLIWMYSWLIDSTGFYAVLAIFQPYNDGWINSIRNRRLEDFKSSILKWKYS